MALVLRLAIVAVCLPLLLASAIPSRSLSDGLQNEDDVASVAEELDLDSAGSLDQEQENVNAEEDARSPALDFWSSYVQAAGPALLEKLERRGPAPNFWSSVMEKVLPALLKSFQPSNRRTANSAKNGKESWIEERSPGGDADAHLGGDALRSLFSHAQERLSSRGSRADEFLSNAQDDQLSGADADALFYESRKQPAVSSSLWPSFPKAPSLPMSPYAYLPKNLPVKRSPQDVSSHRPAVSSSFWPSFPKSRGLPMSPYAYLPNPLPVKRNPAEASEAISGLDEGDTEEAGKLAADGDAAELGDEKVFAAWEAASAEMAQTLGDVDDNRREWASESDSDFDQNDHELDYDDDDHLDLDDDVAGMDLAELRASKRSPWFVRLNKIKKFGKRLLQGAGKKLLKGAGSIALKLATKAVLGRKKRGLDGATESETIMENLSRSQGTDASHGARSSRLHDDAKDDQLDSYSTAAAAPVWEGGLQVAPSFPGLPRFATRRPKAPTTFAEFLVAAAKEGTDLLILSLAKSFPFVSDMPLFVPNMQKFVHALLEKLSSGPQWRRRDPGERRLSELLEAAARNSAENLLDNVLYHLPIYMKRSPAMPAITRSLQTALETRLRLELAVQRSPALLHSLSTYNSFAAMAPGNLGASLRSALLFQGPFLQQLVEQGLKFLSQTPLIRNNPLLSSLLPLVKSYVDQFLTSSAIKAVTGRRSADCRWLKSRSSHLSDGLSARRSLYSAARSLIHILRQVPEVKSNKFLVRVVDVMERTVGDAIYSGSSKAGAVPSSAGLPVRRALPLP